MAKQEFLRYLRVARNLLVHQQVQTGSHVIDPDIVNRADIWLTPKSVQGFDIADFSELGADRQRELQIAVNDFLATAKQVPPQRPATMEQVRQAQPALERILALLNLYLPAPPEAQQLEEALKSVSLPSWVASWDFEFATDEDEAPVVWVDLYVDEYKAPRNELGRFASQLTMQIQQALAAQGSRRWPYIRVRTVAEHTKA